MNQANKAWEIVHVLCQKYSEDCHTWPLLKISTITETKIQPIWLIPSNLKRQPKTSNHTKAHRLQKPLASNSKWKWFDLLKVTLNQLQSKSYNLQCNLQLAMHHHIQFPEHQYINIQRVAADCIRMGYIDNWIFKK